MYKLRNMTSLYVKFRCRVSISFNSHDFTCRCIKAALLPSIANVAYTFATRAIASDAKPNFGENFPVPISVAKLATKTLQVIRDSDPLQTPTKNRARAPVTTTRSVSLQLDKKHTL